MLPTRSRGRCSCDNERARPSHVRGRARSSRRGYSSELCVMHFSPAVWMQLAGSAALAVAEPAASTPSVARVRATARTVLMVNSSRRGDHGRRAAPRHRPTDVDSPSTTDAPGIAPPARPVDHPVQLGLLFRAPVVAVAGHAAHRRREARPFTLGIVLERRWRLGQCAGRELLGPLLVVGHVTHRRSSPACGTSPLRPGSTGRTGDRGSTPTSSAGAPGPRHADRG